MPLPRWVALANKRFTNRLVEPIMRRFRFYAVIHHRGRTTGTSYRTPVYLFTDDDASYVALTYGSNADWLRNVLAGGGFCEAGGTTRALTEIEVVGREEAWGHLPRLVRLFLRTLRVEDFLRFQQQTSTADEPDR